MTAERMSIPSVSGERPGGFPFGVVDTLNVIDTVLSKPPWQDPFIPGRYPYTYAYDFLRSHHEAFGLPAGLSRADCAGLLRGRKDKEQIVHALADAYCKEQRIVVPEDVPKAVTLEYGHLKASPC